MCAVQTVDTRYLPMAVGAGGGLASPLTLSKLRWGGRVVVVMVVATVVMVVLMVVLMVVVVGLGLGLEEGRGMKLAAITQPGSVSGQEGRCSCTGEISTRRRLVLAFSPSPS